MRRASLAVLIIVLAAGCAGRQSAQSPSAPAASSGSGRTPAVAQSVPRITLPASELSRIITALQGMPKGERSGRGVEAKARSLGPDVTAALGFVRDEIAGEIYPGVLRGAHGTLAADAGNAVDKALLLGALLQVHGRTVRYAFCTLDDGRAGQLVDLLQGSRGAAPAEDISSLLRAELLEQGFSEDRASQITEAWLRTGKSLEEEVRRTAESDLAAVRGALEQAGVRPRPESTARRLREEASAHVWVQVEDNGMWQDLDPSFPDAQLGQSFCTPAETHAAPPAGIHQTVTFRIRNEYASGGRLRAETALEHRAPAVDLHGAVVQFLNAPEPSDALEQGDGSSANSFIPVLRIGEAVVVGREFQVNPRPAPAGPGGLFGSMTGQTAGGEATATQLVAQWMDLEFTAPGRRTAVSRAIMDGLAPADRASGTVTVLPVRSLLSLQLMQPHALAVSTGRLDTLQMIEAAYSEIDAQAMGRVFALDLSTDLSQDAARDIGALLPPALTARALALAHAADRALSWGGAGARVYRDQPLVVITHRSLRRSADGREAFVGVSSDLRQNAVRVVHAGTDEEAFWATVRQGVLDGALERHLAAHVLFRRDADDPVEREGQAMSTSLLAHLAHGAGFGLRGTDGTAAPQWLRETAPGDAGHRLAGEVTPATAVVGPSSPVLVGGERRFGIWTVDLRTGQTLALMESGLRQALTEYEKIKRDVNFFWTAWRNCTVKGYKHCDLLRKWYRQALSKQVDYELALPAYEWKTVMYFFGAVL